MINRTLNKFLSLFSLLKHWDDLDHSPCAAILSLPTGVLQQCSDLGQETKLIVDTVDCVGCLYVPSYLWEIRPPVEPSLPPSASYPSSFVSL